MNKWLFFSLGTVLLDQAAKLFFLTFFPQIIVFNQGISFGLFPSVFWPLINLFILIVIFIYFRKEPLTGLIFGGGLANLLDRLFRGRVVDFINLRVWPVFNLADIFICLGAGLLLYDKVLKKHSKALKA